MEQTLTKNISIKKTNFKHPKLDKELDAKRPLKHQKIEDIKSKFTFENITDLINIIPKRPNNYDIMRLNNVIFPLFELNNLVGMDNVKKQIIDQILYFSQGIHDADMLHTVIMGKPGVGKTTLARIIGNVYIGLGLCQNNNFIIAKRSDLIGRYLGETAIKTQGVIDSAIGGVLFIDEAYSLGNESSGKQDSYSKECIDTINQNLSEKAGQFICILAGYEDKLESCFFSCNSGLKRRFPWSYNLKEYTDKELRQILFNKIYANYWFIYDINTISEKWFSNKMDSFENQGGDMELLFVKIKIAHSKRVFGLPYKYKKCLIKNDFDEGYSLFMENKKKNDDKPPEFMYT